MLTHPFLDWLTTYAIALFAPVSWHWYSGDAIFIVDWVYWLLMIAGITWSAMRWRRAGHPGRPAQIAGPSFSLYIALNLAESSWAERTTAEAVFASAASTRRWSSQVRRRSPSGGGAWHGEAPTAGQG